MGNALKVRWLTGVLGAALVFGISGCSAPIPSDALTWAEFTESGMPADTEVAVSIGRNFDSDDQRYLALISRSGHTTLVRADNRYDGRPTAAGKSLCWTGFTANHLITTDGVVSTDRKSEPGMGLWSGIAADGSCQSILNVGGTEDGYLTLPTWEHNGKPMRGAILSPPGPGGSSPDALWVRSGGDSRMPPEPTLFRTDLETGQTNPFMSWVQPTATSESGQEFAFSAGYATNIFWHDGRLHYLEDLSISPKEGEVGQLRPNVTQQLRLASIDVATRTHESTFLEDRSIGILDQPDEEPASRVSSATFRGHYAQGGIFVISGLGEIVRVDIDTRTITRLGKVQGPATRAVEASAAWGDTELNLVVQTEDRKVYRQTYDLRTGDLTETSDVVGLSEILSRNTYFESAALIAQ